MDCQVFHPTIHRRGGAIFRRVHAVEVQKQLVPPLARLPHRFLVPNRNSRFSRWNPRLLPVGHPLHFEGGGLAEGRGAGGGTNQTKSNQIIPDQTKSNNNNNNNKKLQ
jgi:hypothetical protein